MNKKHRNQSTLNAQLFRRLSLTNTNIIFTAIFILTPIIFGLLSVSIGQDNNWDLRNYHYYNPYAFFNGRLSFDFASAQLQTFLNPVLDFPFYFLVTQFSPKTVGFVMGAIQGFNFFLLFCICYYLFQYKSPPTRLLFTFVSATAGVYAPIMIGELGNTTNDVVTSLFVLGALLIVVHRTVQNENLNTSTFNYVLAMGGLLIGLGIGLKLTLAIFGIGFLIAQLTLQKNWLQRIKSTAAVTLGLAAGIFISAGFWMYRLWNLYGNPLFPFYNGIFKSPYMKLENFSDSRYLPEGLFDHIVFPFYFLFSNHYTDPQHYYRDARFAIIYVLIIIIAFIFLLKWSRANSKTKRVKMKNVVIPIHQFLIIFFISSFIIWQLKFSILRYTNALELLGPAVIIILLSYIIKSEYYRILTYSLLLVVVVVEMRAIQIDRLPWGSTFFQVQIPGYADPDNSVVLITQNRPWGYLIPAFPKSTRFVSMNNNFIKPTQNTMFQKEIRQVLSSHDGPFYLLSRKEYLPYDARLLASHRLGIDPRGSLPIRSRHERDGLRLWIVKKWE